MSTPAPPSDPPGRASLPTPESSPLGVVTQPILRAHAFDIPSSAGESCTSVPTSSMRSICICSRHTPRRSCTESACPFSFSWLPTRTARCDTVGFPETAERVLLAGPCATDDEADAGARGLVPTDALEEGVVTELDVCCCPAAFLSPPLRVGHWALVWPCSPHA